METFLIAALAAGLKGGSVAVVAYFEGLSIDQWLTFGASAVEAVTPELATRLGLKEQSPATFIKSLANGVADELLSKGAQDWFSANADAAMRLQPGMGEH